MGKGNRRKSGRSDRSRGRCESVPVACLPLVTPIKNIYAATFGYAYEVGVAPPAVITPYTGVDAQSGYISVPIAFGTSAGFGFDDGQPMVGSPVIIAARVPNPAVTPYVNPLPAAVIGSLYQITSLPTGQPQSNTYILKPLNVLACDGGWEVGDWLQVEYGNMTGGSPIVQMGTPAISKLNVYVGPTVIDRIIRVTNPLPNACKTGPCKKRGLVAEFSNYGDDDCSSSSSSSCSTRSCSDSYSESCSDSDSSESCTSSSSSSSSCRPRRRRGGSYCSDSDDIEDLSFSSGARSRSSSSCSDDYSSSGSSC